jgi:hypothetical protein
MTASKLSVLVWKEVRGLRTAWLSSLAVIMLTGFAASSPLPAAALVYLVGAVSLGALSIGQELGFKTVTILLAQPLSRPRLYAIKWLVLTGLVLSLAVAVTLMPAADSVLLLFGGTEHSWWRLALAVPVLCGLFLAPPLTMACRSALGGIVLTLAVPLVLWLAGDMAATIVYGVADSGSAQGWALRVSVLGWGMAVSTVLAAASSWPLFARLEAVEARSSEISLPSFGERSRLSPMNPARRSRWWLLVMKELRLQQLTFAVTGLYLVGWFSVLAVRNWKPELSTPFLIIATTIHGSVIALMAGSLASAEERQLGTLGWHMLLPAAAWKQWMVKAGVALGVTSTLAFGVPALLVLFTLSPDAEAIVRSNLPSGQAGALAVAIVSLYISSLCSNGLRAILFSLLPLLLFSGIAATLAFQFLGRSRVYSLSPRELAFLEPIDRALHRLLVFALPMVMPVVVGIVLLLLLRFGLTNHRSAERSARRIAMQVGSAVLVLILGAALWTGGLWVYRKGVHDAVAQWNLDSERR